MSFFKVGRFYKAKVSYWEYTHVCNNAFYECLKQNETILILSDAKIERRFGGEHKETYNILLENGSIAKTWVFVYEDTKPDVNFFFKKIC